MRPSTPLSYLANSVLSAVLCSAVVIALASPIHAQTVEPLRGWADEPAVAATYADLSPQPLDAPWFESWDFWMWADDGTFVLVQFLTSSLGFGIELQGSARMLHIAPDTMNDGSTRDGISRADRGFQGRDGDWGWDADNPVDIFWHRCHVIGDERGIELHIDGRDHRSHLEVDLTPLVPLAQPGDGRIALGWEGHVAYTMQAIPHFSFAGRVNLKDHRDDPDDWQPIRGVGTFSHSRSNAFPYRIGERWLRFRALRQDGLTIYYDEIRAPDGFSPDAVGWMVVALDGVVVFDSVDATVVTTATSVESGDAGTYAVPTGYVIHARDGADEVVVEVGESHLVSAENPLRQLGALVRRVLARLMSPMEYELTNTYRARLSIGGVEAAVAGQGWTTTNFPLADTP